MIDPKIRDDFPMLRSYKEMQGHPFVYLDNASTTFKPDCVAEAENFYNTMQTCNSHRGDYDLSYVVDEHVRLTRVLVASFINADPREVVFTSGATAALNTVAFGYGLTHLKPGDEILLTLAEHASNILPWFKVAKMTGAVIRYIELTPEGRVTVENAKKAIGPKTRIVSIAQVTNVLGYEAPVKEIAKLVHAVGGVICVDGAQSVPHINVDVKDLDCDFLAFSGHKLCAPTGTGVLYGKYALLDKMEPFALGGGMNIKFFPNGEMDLLPPPVRFEAGTINVGGIYGLGKAIEYIQKVGLDNIAEHDQMLKKRAIEGLRKCDNVTIYNATSEAGIVAFNIAGMFAQDAGTWLNSKGIACRSGSHCAKLLHEQIHTIATVRASFYFYNTVEEVDHFVDTIAKGGDFLDAYF